MKVCNRCFEDPKIVTWIETHGESVELGYTCEYCRRSDGVIRTVDAMDLSEKLQSIVTKFYTHEHEHGLLVSAMSYVERDEEPAMFAGLSNLDDVCFGLFDDDSEILANFIVEYRNWRDEAKGGDVFFDSANDEVWKENCWFDRTESSWFDFSENVKYSARFFDHPTYSRTDFLESLVPVFDKLITSSYNEIFCRVRPITSIEIRNKILMNPEKELDKPPRRLAGYNRFSPAGISYIYVADSIDTALIETRSIVGKESAYGEFELSRELRIVDLRKKTLIENLDYFDEDFSSSEYCFLSSFTKNIALPIDENDKLIDYVPTQIVSEFLWSKGYDGFSYDSSLSRTGFNLVVFDKKYKLRQYGIVENQAIEYRMIDSYEIERGRR